MKRKIVKLGPATMVVSLPSKWIKDQNIKAGDEVNLEEKDTELTISTQGTSTITKETINLSPYSKLMKRILVSRYLKGNDEIEVIFDTLDKSRIIQRRVDELIGVEIIDQGKDRIVIKDLAKNEEDNFENILKRILYLLNTLADESLKTIQEQKTDLEYTADIEKSINKFTDYCFRILNKKGYPQRQKIATLYCALFLIEEIADEYKNLNSHITQRKLKLDKEYIQLYANINNQSKDMQKLFLKFSFDDAIVLAEKHDAIIKDIRKKLDNPKIKVNEVILLKHFEKISEHIIKVMGQLLNVN